MQIAITNEYYGKNSIGMGKWCDGMRKKARYNRMKCEFLNDPFIFHSSLSTEVAMVDIVNVIEIRKAVNIFFMH